MNISKHEQRVLHALAQGGVIAYERAPGGQVTEVTCVTRDGLILGDCSLEVFRKLRRKRLIESRASSPYRISAQGRRNVRAQVDNR
ncbi:MULTISPECIES: YjhX family toxin [unclassified Roseivivax]|uniref:YjhX family toxin n=1 Tax=Roseivivax sp. GX 12232 TaxID=2900547 RepID=UPI001E2CBC73|nr:YjhX family toxin [Roseivivax sp. GX 12232]MCE0505432.1 YjhX family toxin [Roseivivax sp. GX 12232]